MQMTDRVTDLREPEIRRIAFPRFMALSCLTLGLYSAYLILRYTPVIGRLVGRNRFSLPLAMGLTVVTLGIFPAVYVVVLAFDLQRHSLALAMPLRQPLLGRLVLIADITACFIALVSGGVAIIVSTVIWSYGSWLLFKELNLYANSNA
jgi:hypothetical protein